MKDIAHIETDKFLDELVKEIDIIYSDVYEELFKKLENALDWKTILNIKDKKKRMLEAKKRRRLEELIKQMAIILQNKNKIAADLIQNKEIDIFALNYNYGGYLVEHLSGFDISFLVMNNKAVEELLKETTPVFTKMAYKGLRDRKEIERELKRELTKGILQGESIQEIARRVDKVTDKNNYGAKRIAQTETTRIESSGRQKAFKEGEKAGLRLEKKWISTIDKRTRESHRKLMGKTVPLDNKFSNGLLYPGAPGGKASEVINCRCTQIVEFVGLAKSKEEMKLDKRLKEMSFKEWEENKLGKKNNKNR